ncbi:hypothetical protein B296_00054284 [Ensete ventricosum]|uniref:Uncharacterized protein n=1 Tax=Ensete ventricosum TaxID=4639 RepID=A0A426XS03_ENSVE|nr:hypothetical protein B296_00054284 [Ensete ventricosum]
MSWKFKILIIPNVLAHGKSYEHGFMKKRDSHKLCVKWRAKWSFDWFFVQCLENSTFDIHYSHSSGLNGVYQHLIFICWKMNSLYAGSTLRKIYNGCWKAFGLSAVIQ